MVKRVLGAECRMSKRGYDPHMYFQQFDLWIFFFLLLSDKEKFDEVFNQLPFQNRSNYFWKGTWNKVCFSTMWIQLNCNLKNRSNFMDTFGLRQSIICDMSKGSNYQRNAKFLQKNILARKYLWRHFVSSTCWLTILLIKH